MYVYFTIGIIRLKLFDDSLIKENQTLQQSLVFIILKYI